MLHYEQWPVGGDQTWTIATHNVAETMYKIRKKYVSECGGQGGICRGGSRGTSPSPSHWFVWKLRGNGKGEGRGGEGKGKGKGGEDHLPYFPPLASASNTTLMVAPKVVGTLFCQVNPNTLKFDPGNTCDQRKVYRFLPARRSKRGLCYSNVSVCPSVRTFVCLSQPVLCLND